MEDAPLMSIREMVDRIYYCYGIGGEIIEKEVGMDILLLQDWRRDY